jgi:alpha-mannosidase
MRSEDGFDAAGRSLPAEMLPGRIAFGGVSFVLSPAAAGKPSTTVAHGQTIPLPTGRHRRLHVLAASADGDQKVTLRVGETPVDLVIQDWGGYIGQWDNRTWATHEEPMPPRPGMPAPPPGTPPRMRTVLDYRGLVPGYVKPAPVAWFASHRHTAEGANEPYSFAYLYDHTVDVPAQARTLTLPQNDKVRVLAVTVAEEGPPVRPVQPLYDTLRPWR